jgi:hypothetical protein
MIYVDGLCVGYLLGAYGDTQVDGVQHGIGRGVGFVVASIV